MNIAIVGHLYFAYKLAISLRDKGHNVTVFYHNAEWNNKSFQYYKMIKNVDMIYFFCAVGLRRYFRAFILRYIFRKKIVVHFVGSDSHKFLNYNMYKRFRWKSALNISHKVFGISPSIVQELSPHINIELLPMSFEDFNSRFKPFPEKLTALVYLPEKNPTFYGYDIINKLARKNQNIHFIILGYNKFPNCQNITLLPIDPEKDMNDLYYQSSVLIRLTEHDGLSNMVMESLSRGRHVIWTTKFPYTHFCKRNINSIQKELNIVKSKSDNRKAMRWVQQNFNQSKLMDNLETIIKSL